MRTEISDVPVYTVGAAAHWLEGIEANERRRRMVQRLALEMLIQRQRAHIEEVARIATTPRERT